MPAVKMGGRYLKTSQAMKGILQYAGGLLVFLLVALVILKNTSYSITLDGDYLKPKEVPAAPSQSKVRSCGLKVCPAGTFSFSISSGAANVVAPKICIQNRMVLGSVQNNAGVGLNLVVLNGRTLQVVKLGHYDMYSGDVQPLIEVLQGLEKGNIVLMASFDEPATKLTAEARSLIEGLGSTSIKALGFRDNWVFVGGKGDVAKGTFEKHMKNNQETNKYDGWPEMLQMDGCIPLFHE
ncbi:protein FAM3C [Gadus morhua]|uniref:ILEI/PANDER domain-containing protein n=1 Tax=Gadus morhua TaxID=8049 RepID=A0A8C5AW65_GADMO|nr:protein FAM3C-like [Gadus morhua]